MKQVFLSIGVVVMLLLPLSASAGAPTIGVYIFCPAIFAAAGIDTDSIGATPKDWLDAWSTVKPNRNDHRLFYEKLPVIDSITFEWFNNDLDLASGRVRGAWPNSEESEMGIITTKQREQIKNQCGIDIDTVKVNEIIKEWLKNLEFRQSNLYIIPYSRANWRAVNNPELETNDETYIDEDYRKSWWRAWYDSWEKTPPVWRHYQKRVGNWIVVHENNYNALNFSLEFVYNFVEASFRYIFANITSR